MICSEAKVEPPGKPAWFPPLRMLRFAMMLESLLLIILTISLRAVSSNVMGLVLLRLQFHSVSFGIGYIVASLHFCGMSLRIKQYEINLRSVADIEFPKCLIISLLISEGPGALPFVRSEIAEDHSVSVGVSRTD